MPRAETEIVNKLGLHARASAKLTQMASSFPCEVWLERNARRVTPRSTRGALMRAAAKGSTITIDTEGDKADDAMHALQELIADKFGEGE